MPETIVLRIPNIPRTEQPLPDEAFDSWIDFVQDESGLLTVARRNRTLGIEGSTHFKQDPAPRHAALTAIANASGCRPIDVSRIVSTLPFWECIKGSWDDAALRGRVSVGNRGSRNNSGRLFACRGCFAHDQQEFGRAYLHREHQIPGTRTCRTHNESLFDRCHVCGAPVARSLELHRVRYECRCKTPFPHPTEDFPQGNVWMKLADWNFAALNAPPGTIDYRASLSFIADAAGIAKSDLAFRSILCDVFGEQGWNWLALDGGMRSITWEECVGPLALANRLTKHVHIVSALFVSLGLSFQESRAELSAFVS